MTTPDADIDSTNSDDSDRTTVPEGERPTEFFIGPMLNVSWWEPKIARAIVKLRYNWPTGPVLFHIPYFDAVVMGWAWDILFGSRDVVVTDTEDIPETDTTEE